MATRRGTIRRGLYVLGAASPFDGPDWPDTEIEAYIAAALPGLSDTDRLKLLEYARSLGPTSATWLNNIDALFRLDRPLMALTVETIGRLPFTERRASTMEDIRVMAHACGAYDIEEQLKRAEAENPLAGAASASTITLRLSAGPD